MTTAKPSMTPTDTTAQGTRFRLPEPPKREPDEMTSYDQLHKHGTPRYLALHFGNPDTTLVEADRWIVPNPEYNKSRARRPDLLIAFEVGPADYEASNGYIVSEQGKPPDFVLEVASESTADSDVGAKRDYYAMLGIPEYWRFDQTGEYHGAKLAGDRLVGNAYVPLAIEELPGGVLQGYSETLNLYLRWDKGQLGWYDPTNGQHIPTYEGQRDRADHAESRADNAESRADNAESRADNAEARVQELEAELQNLRQGLT